jgi:hypothetical protein
MFNHDWNLYKEQFPTRYWQPGIFDKKLLEKLEILINNGFKIKSMLDVGGGVNGTMIIKDLTSNNKIPVDFLDPFVLLKPDWMRNKINWNSSEKYDLIIARGSINYLTIEQLEKLKSMMSANAILIANTFLTAPDKNWTEREVINVTEEKGIEKSRLVGKIIEHEIIFPTYTINHNFFYYSLEDYNKIFTKLEIETYGKNSSLIFFKND